MPPKSKKSKVEIDATNPWGELQALMDMVNAERGAGTVTKLEGTSGRWPDSDIIRTGSLGLDMAMGIGGFPKGRIGEIYGEYSSGKTTTCLQAIAAAQRQGNLVVYIDAENALDPNYAKKLGVDLNGILINQPESLQQAIDLMKWLLVRSKELPGGKDIVIVVDSIPALVPSEVQENDAEQQHRALAPRLWSTHLPDIGRLAAKHNGSIFLINQERDTMATKPWEKKTNTAGGRAIKFYCSWRIKVSRKQITEGEGTNKVTIGQQTFYSVEKNKVGSPFKKAEMFLPFGQPTDRAQDIIQAARDLGYIQEGVKAEKGELVSKANYFSYVLAEGDLDLILADDPTFELKADSKVGSADCLSVQYEKRFMEQFRGYPKLLDAIEQRVLDTLNEGSGVDVEDEVTFDDEVKLEAKDSAEPEGDENEFDAHAEALKDEPEEVRAAAAGASVSAAFKPETADVRAWAQKEGKTVPERGRLPQSLVDEYLAANNLVNA